VGKSKKVLSPSMSIIEILYIVEIIRQIDELFIS
jgi:hypothetical protein